MTPSVIAIAISSSFMYMQGVCFGQMSSASYNREATSIARTSRVPTCFTLLSHVCNRGRATIRWWWQPWQKECDIFATWEVFFRCCWNMINLMALLVCVCLSLFFSGVLVRSYFDGVYRVRRSTSWRQIGFLWPPSQSVGRRRVADELVYLSVCFMHYSSVIAFRSTTLVCLSVVRWQVLWGH